MMFCFSKSLKGIKPMQIRTMSLAEINRVVEIDRSEQITTKYVYQAGELQAIPHEFDVPTWSGEWLSENIEQWSSALAAGSTMLGAFVDDVFAGFAILGHQFIGEQHDQIQLVALYISRPYRRQGIAEKLVETASQMAKERGATYLYISSAESAPTVNFYLKQGCFLAPKVDPALFALEPEDIHLLKKL
jgi:GNAT superfamily N-acetyltransferase